MEEIWKDVEGFNDIYIVSNYGRVKSLKRTTNMIDGRTRRTPEKILNSKPGRRGYVYVNLYKDSYAFSRTVHSLVARAFLGDCPLGQEVLHKDSNRSNNRLDNLRYGTQAQNQFDSIEFGSHFQYNKVTCPLGHKLVEPNLIQANLRAGFRACLACARGRATVNYRKKQGIVWDLKKEADSRYKHIMRNQPMYDQ